jgi:small subunit ribosomal protein S16
MLAIRMQRLGRKGHPTYRVVVQDVRQTPTSGKYVALLGSYDPHAKTTTLVKDKAEFYLTHGAQPSERVARLFTAEGIALPTWVKQPSDHTRTIRHTDKLRKNRPAQPAAATEPVAAEVEETTEVTEEIPAAEVVNDEAVEAPKEVAETEAEVPAEVATPEEPDVSAAETVDGADASAEDSEKA